MVEKTTHTNLSAYDNHENFILEDDTKSYKLEKLKSAEKNIAFVKKHFKKAISVLEIGSGNSKFLYSLYLSSLLKKGYGVEISENRFNFANKWKEEIEARTVMNFNENAITFNISKIPQIDLIYCVDLAFQFFDPVENGCDVHLLRKYHDHLTDGGKIILELDCHHRLISNMKNDQLKTWQELNKPDPWKYLLWDCYYNAAKKHLRINKTFIKRDLAEISKSDVILKNYERDDVINMLKECGFKDVKVYENWQLSDDTLVDEFIVMGTKQEGLK